MGWGRRGVGLGPGGRVIIEVVVGREVESRGKGFEWVVKGGDVVCMIDEV